MLLILVFVKASLLIGAAAIGTALFRTRPAAARSAVWTFTFLALVLLPLAEGRLPAWSLPTFATRAPASISGTDRGEEPAAVPAPDPSPGGRAGPTRRAAGDSQSLATLTVARRPWVYRTDTRQWLFLAWVGGAAFVLTLLVARLVRLALLTGRAEPSGLDLERWVRGMALRMGVGRPVEVRLSAAVRVPLTWGILRPVILLPVEFDRWPAKRRQSVVLHELGHVARADWIGYLLGEVARGLFWANPAVWLGLRRARIEQECSADDIVLRQGVQPTAYATDLYEIALGASRLIPHAGLAAARPSTLRHRVTAILCPRTCRALWSPAAFAILGLAIPGLGLATAGLEPIPGYQQALTEFAIVDRALCAAAPARLQAIQALGRMHRDDALAALTVLLRDGDQRVRRAALASLSRLHDRRTVVPVMLSFADRESGVRLAAVAMARQLTPTGTAEETAVARALAFRVATDPDPAVRAVAVRELARVDHPVAVEGILHGLADAHPEVRRQAVLAAQESASSDPRLKTPECGRSAGGGPGATAPGPASTRTPPRIA